MLSISFHKGINNEFFIIYLSIFLFSGFCCSNSSKVSDNKLTSISSNTALTSIVSISEPSQNNDSTCLQLNTIIDTAKLFVDLKWKYDNEKMDTFCSIKPHLSSNMIHTGMAYKWGGNDSPTTFSNKLKLGKVPGSHADDGIVKCCAGIDCSGFIAYCWGEDNSQAKKRYTTRNIHEIATPLDTLPNFKLKKHNSNLQKGDALNRSGKHILLYVKSGNNGKAVVYEAVGGSKRKVVKSEYEWSFLDKKGYKPLRYQGVCK